MSCVTRCLPIGLGRLGGNRNMRLARWRPSTDELQALLRHFHEANQEDVKGMQKRLAENTTGLVQGMARANQRRFEAVEGDVP